MAGPVQRRRAAGAISYRRGIIGPARPVRGDLSSVAGCCCPLLYSYVGRGGVRSPTGAVSSARRGAGRWRGGACPAAAGAISYRRRGRGVIHGKAAHGKRPTEKGNKKRGRRGGGPCLPLFSRHSSGSVIFPGCRPVRAAGIHRGPFFPAWPSKCILAHFRPLERRRLLFFPRPLSVVSNLFVRILLNSDYSLFFSFHLWAFCSPLFISESL